MALRRVLCLATAAALLMPTSAALAETKTVKDPRGDNGARGDILSVKVKNTPRRVRVTVKVRNLQDEGGVQFAFKYAKNVNSPGEYLASVARDEDGRHKGLMHNRPKISPYSYKSIPCKRLRAQWNADKDFVVLSWPHGCETYKANTKTLHAVANAYYTTPGEFGGLVYHDDYSKAFNVPRG